MSATADEVRLLIRTRHAIVTIRTVEEQYAARMIREAARVTHMNVLEWSVSEGLRRSDNAGGLIAGTESLVGALRFMRGNDHPSVYILKDAARHLSGPQAERLLRDVAVDFSRDSRTVFMIDPEGELPAGLRSLSVPLELPLPDEREITEIVRQTVRELSEFGAECVRLTRGQFESLLANLRGLTRTEVAQVVAEALLNDGVLDAKDIDAAMELKRRRLRATGVLDYIPPPDPPPKVGGMAGLQRWLGLRAKALSRKAREFGLEPPRGILLLGVQGCGKSLMARFVAASWRLPLLRMDVGALYDKFVGETERHLRHAFSVASAMAPCVLWIDEIEKAFASAGAGAAGAATDAGLSQRMFGQLLTWMQDHPDPVFLVATANDVSALPPELMRKGRFDEVFFVDLPSGEARREIFRIHLSRRKREAEEFDLPGLSAAAEGFSGSEIEQAIVSAMYAAFAAGRDVTTKDIADELARTRPLSVLMAERVADLRAWAAQRCVPAD